MVSLPPPELKKKWTKPHSNQWEYQICDKDLDLQKNLDWTKGLKEIAARFQYWKGLQNLDRNYREKKKKQKKKTKAWNLELGATKSKRWLMHVMQVQEPITKGLIFVQGIWKEYSNQLAYY